MSSISMIFVIFVGLDFRVVEKNFLWMDYFFDGVVFLIIDDCVCLVIGLWQSRVSGGLEVPFSDVGGRVLRASLSCLPI